MTNTISSFQLSLEEQIIIVHSVAKQITETEETIKYHRQCLTRKEMDKKRKNYHEFALKDSYPKLNILQTTYHKIAKSVKKYI